MNERIEDILAHMLEDARDVVEFTRHIASFEEFCDNNMARKAVVMSLLNIGELAHHLPQDYTKGHKGLPWEDMVGMRNYAAHGYHIMNLEIVWDTAVNSIPELLVFLEKELAQ
jgi:uncharacterized protein with HEPN domain